jgi:hypothetical protein
MEDKYHTDFLFAQPSFVSGAARTLDMFATFNKYNISGTPEEADMRALESDWAIVGQDFSKAFQEAVERKKR